MIFGTYHGNPVKKNRRKMAAGALKDSDMVIFGSAGKKVIPLIQREIRNILDNSNDSVYLIVPSSMETGRFDNGTLSDVLAAFVDYTYFENFYVKYDLQEITVDVLAERKKDTHKWLYFLGHIENNKWFHRQIAILKDMQQTAHITMTFQMDVKGIDCTGDNKPAADEALIKAYGETPLKSPLICLYKTNQESIAEVAVRYLKRTGCIPKVVQEVQSRLDEKMCSGSCDAIVIGKDVNGFFHVQPFSTTEDKEF